MDETTNTSEIRSLQAELLQRLRRAMGDVWPDGEIRSGEIISSPFIGFRCEVEGPLCLTPDDVSRLSRRVRRMAAEQESSLLSPQRRAESPPHEEHFHLVPEPEEIAPAVGGSRARWRIHGLARSSARELARQVARIDAAQERDHRWLGRDLELFAQLPEQAGEFLWSSEGALLLRLLEEATREHLQAAGYSEARVAAGPEAKHVEIIRRHALRGLRGEPSRFFEIRRLRRIDFSRPGAGLRHAREFTRDIETTFLSPSRLAEETEHIVGVVTGWLRRCGVSVSLRAFLPPTGDEEDSITRALRGSGVPFTTPHRCEAVRRPRIEWLLPSVYGTLDQPSGWMEIDDPVSLEGCPGRLSSEHHSARLVSCLRSSMHGAIERTLAAIIEQTDGHLPLWLCPVQVLVMNISRSAEHPARAIEKRLRDVGIRCAGDYRRDQYQTRLRSALARKRPYIAVVGPREAETGLVSLQGRLAPEAGWVLPIESLMARIQREARTGKP